MSTTHGLITRVGDDHHAGSLDIAPAARDGQAMLAIWVGPDGDTEPSLLDCRSVLLLVASCPASWPRPST